MGLFSVGCDNISDKSFDKGLKKIQKMFPADIVLEKQLKFAFNHQSIKSAFWWYEHLTVKPNTGSDNDTLLLHRKFYNSLKRDSYNERFVATQEDIKKFLELVLPDDYDYAATGETTSSKSNAINDIMKYYNDKKEQTRYITPFILFPYWWIYHYDEVIVDGEVNKSAYKDWRRELDKNHDKEVTCLHDRLGWDLFKNL